MTALMYLLHEDRSLAHKTPHLPHSRETTDLPVEVDDSSESVSKKIRLAQMDQVSYMLTIGDQELANQTVSLRSRENKVFGEMELSSFLEKAEAEYKARSLTPYFV